MVPESKVLGLALNCLEPRLVLLWTLPWAVSLSFPPELNLMFGYLSWVLSPPAALSHYLSLLSKSEDPEYRPTISVAMEQFTMKQDFQIGSRTHKQSPWKITEQKSSWNCIHLPCQAGDRRIMLAEQLPHESALSRQKILPVFACSSSPAGRKYFIVIFISYALPLPH